MDSRSGNCSPNTEVVNLLWTGGWDSTYQLLKLLLEDRVIVRPFYLIDADRRSTGIELLTIKNIKKRLFQDFTDTEKLILPTEYFSVSDIRPDPSIDFAFQSLLDNSFMGDQYDWLARFCREQSVDNMQLCIHCDDKAYGVVKDFISDSGDKKKLPRVSAKFYDSHEYTVFRYFSFPILDITKLDMLKKAKRCGWEEIMSMTWFCHRPTKGNRPCGICNPCQYTMEEGLGWRIPLPNRLVGSIYKVTVRPLKLLVKRAVRQRSSGVQV